MRERFGILAVTILFFLTLSHAYATAGSFEFGRPTNPATGRCEIYDWKCKPTWLFVRPDESRNKIYQLAKPPQKLLLPRDLNDRSSNSLFLPNDSNYGGYSLPPNYLNYVVSCREARLILRRKGYRNIKTIACGGNYHQFIAEKRNANYLLKMRARSGQIIILRRIT